MEMAVLRPACALLCLLAAAAAPAALALCPPGTAGAGCAGCAKGTFSPGGDTPCWPCPTCYTTPGANSTSSASCVCAPGCGLVSGACSACPLGSYSAGGNMTNKTPPCIPCPAGKTTALAQRAALSACTVCRPGYGGANCLACALGSWSAGGNTSAGGNPKPNCTACAASTTASTASTRAASCSRCVPGYGVSGASTTCTACAAGFWSAGGNATTPKPKCTACSAGTTTNSALRTSKDACAKCVPGYGFATVNNVAVCQICARGKWSAGGNATTAKPMCTACKAPFTTAGAGATSSASCTVRICAAGQGDDATCPPCPRGKWAAAGNTTTPVRACTACGANTTTAGTGAASAAACALCRSGYGKLGALNRCDICPPNTFSPGGTSANNKPNCTACPTGTTSAAPGAGACVAAANTCTASNPLCGAQQRCDLTAPNANTTGGACRAAFQCPACPAGYECVSTAASLAFAGSMPWCLKKTTCDPPCGAGEYCKTDRGDEQFALIAPYCRNISSACFGGCNAGLACNPVGQFCEAACIPGGSQCAIPSTAEFRYWCEPGDVLCHVEHCVHWVPSSNSPLPGCASGWECAAADNGRDRECQLRTCYDNCTALGLACVFSGDWYHSFCADARCSPPCPADKVCDPSANTCKGKCGNGTCPDGQICSWRYVNSSSFEHGPETCIPGCDPPCDDPKSSPTCIDYDWRTNKTVATCSPACPHRCKVGFYCDKDFESCRPMACSPACPDGYACAEVAGKPVCRPKCDPTCAAGYACDLTASPPRCILPDPTSFSLVIRISERIQAGDQDTLALSEYLDTPVGFLSNYVGGDEYNPCGPCAGNRTDFMEECGESGGEEGWDWAPHMETFSTVAVFDDARGAKGALGVRWREVHIDVGGALAAGNWSGKADVKVFARGQNMFDYNDKLLPRPLELQVGLLHKATGVTYAESYTTIAPLGFETEGEDGSPTPRCYHGSDALAAEVTVTTTPAKDRLAYSLNIVRPYDPTAPAAPATAAAAAAEALPGDDGAVSVTVAPQVRARMAELRRKRKERRERRRRGRRGPDAPAGPVEPGSP